MEQASARSDSTLKIEDLINELKRNYTVVIVKHNIQQAGRVGDYTVFWMDELVEFEAQPKYLKNLKVVNLRYHENS